MIPKKHMRDRIDHLKRNSLLKKIKFEQYLIHYDTPNAPNFENIENKTSSGFYPTMAFSLLKTERNDETERENKISRSQEIRRTQNQSLYQIQTRRVVKSIMRETFRLSTRQTITNISGLTAKSMTPSIRINRTSPFNNDKYNKSFYIKELNIQNSSPTKKIKEKSMRLSPKRRTYIGTQFYIKQKKYMRTLDVQPPRKQSICAWETENQPWTTKNC